MSSKHIVPLPNPYRCTSESNITKICDWIVLITCNIILLYFMVGAASPHQQCVPGLPTDTECKALAPYPDPAISYPIKESTVPFILINILCPIIWLLIFIINVFIVRYYSSYKQYKQYKINKIILIKFEILLRSLLMSISFTSLLTDILKLSIGRPRPNFTNNNDSKDARKSFPSGHASYVFSVFFLLSLYLMNSLLNSRKLIYFNQNNCNQIIGNNVIKNKKGLVVLINDNDMDIDKDETKDNKLVYDDRANMVINMNQIINVFNGDSYFFLFLWIKLRHFQIISLIISLSPTLFAIWVSSTRLTDYKHHYGDVLGGALIGIGFSFLSFFYYKTEFYYGYDYDMDEIFNCSNADDNSINSIENQDNDVDVVNLAEMSPLNDKLLSTAQT